MSDHVLMCEPTHYRIAYEINPWMSRGRAVRIDEARAQWAGLHDVLVRLGARVELVAPGEDVPDMVFTANAGIVIGRRFVVSNFRFAERQPEAVRFERWFAERGYEVVRLPDDLRWEGEGDVLAGGDRVFAAHGFRTDASALDAVEAVLGEPLLRLELVDPRFYHLDTCLFPVAPGLAACVPVAFSGGSVKCLVLTLEGFEAHA